MDKPCSKCKVIKPFASFYRHRGNADGLSYTCKACSAAAQREYQINNREKRNAVCKRWKQANKEKMRIYYNERGKLRRLDPKYKEARKLICRKYDLKKEYSITPEEVQALILRQGNKCAICRGDKPTHRRNWCVDHDHETGKVRGLVCSKCNLGLGHFQDSITILYRAIEYLRLHLKNTTTASSPISEDQTRPCEESLPLDLFQASPSGQSNLAS